MSTSRRDDALVRFERAVELPLLVLAIAMVPLLLVPLVVDLPSGVQRTFVAIDWLIWGAFAFEYLVRLSLTTRRWAFVRREWLDLLIVVLPFLRPLRVVRSGRALRVLRLARLGLFMGGVGPGISRLLVRHRLHYSLLGTVVVVVAAAGLTLIAEEGAPGASIATLGDALWWAVSTVTTVGYGDVYPTTPAGRGLSVLLMLVGIGLVGVLTANIAAFFLEPEVEAEQTRLDEVMERLDRIETRLNDLQSGPRL